MRIVHVLAPASSGDEGIVACAAALRIDRAEQRVVLVGDAAQERRCWALGVRSTQRVAPMLGSAALTARRLARLIRHESVGAVGRVLVQCWCPATLGAVGRVMHLKEARIGVLLRAPERDERTPGVAAVADHAGATLACFDGAVAAAHVGGRMDGPGLHRIRLLDWPGLTPPGLPARRDELRAGLKLQPGERAIALMADPPRRADAFSFMFTLGLMHTAGCLTVGLVPRGCTNARRAARFLRLNSRRWGLIESDLSLPELLAASDAALVAPSHVRAEGAASCGPASIRLAAQMGIPVAGPPSADLCGHFGPIGADLQARSGEPSASVSALLRLVEDTSYRRKVDQAIAAHTRKAPTERSHHGLLDLWREVANAPADESSLLPSAPGVLA